MQSSGGEFSFSPSLQNALENRAQLRGARGFDERFWLALEEKRARRRTLRGQIEALFEIELGGVAVWRLMGSSLAGSAFPVLVLMICCFNSAPMKDFAPAPLASFWATPFNQRRFWEEAAWKTSARAAAPFVPFEPKFIQGNNLCKNFLVA